CLFRLAGDINRTVLDVGAGFFLHVGKRSPATGFVFVVEAVHHVREPAASGFEEIDLQTWKLVQNSIANDTGKLNHERERMLQSVDLALIFKIVEAETAARSAMDSEGNSEIFGLAKDRMKVGMTEGLAHDRRRRQKSANHVELFHRVA